MRFSVALSMLWARLFRHISPFLTPGSGNQSPVTPNTAIGHTLERLRIRSLRAWSARGSSPAPYRPWPSTFCIVGIGIIALEGCGQISLEGLSALTSEPPPGRRIESSAASRQRSPNASTQLHDHDVIRLKALPRLPSGGTGEPVALTVTLGEQLSASIEKSLNPAFPVAALRDLNPPTITVQIGDKAIIYTFPHGMNRSTPLTWGVIETTFGAGFPKKPAAPTHTLIPMLEPHVPQWATPGTRVVFIVRYRSPDDESGELGKKFWQRNFVEQHESVVDPQGHLTVPLYGYASSFDPKNRNVPIMRRIFALVEQGNTKVRVWAPGPGKPFDLKILEDCLNLGQDDSSSELGERCRHLAVTDRLRPEDAGQNTESKGFNDFQYEVRVPEPSSWSLTFNSGKQIRRSLWPGMSLADALNDAFRSEQGQEIESAISSAGLFVTVVPRDDSPFCAVLHRTTDPLSKILILPEDAVFLSRTGPRSWPSGKYPCGFYAP